MGTGGDANQGIREVWGDLSEHLKSPIGTPLKRFGLQDDGSGAPAYQPNPQNFQLYGSPDAAMRGQGAMTGYGLAAAGQQGRQQAYGDQQYNLGNMAVQQAGMQRYQSQQAQNREGIDLASVAAGRGLATGGLNALNAYAAQSEGPSAAEALLRNQGASNMRQSLALARSGRGTGSAQAMRGAIARNAVTQGETGNQLAALRAQEAQQFQQRRLGALQSAGQLGQGIYGQDIGFSQAQGQIDLGARGQNDALQLGLGQQALGYENVGLGRAASQAQFEGLGQGYGQQQMGWEQLGQQYAGMDLQGRMGFEQTKAAHDLAYAQMAQQEKGAKMGMLGAVIGAFSDRRAKTHVEEIADIRAALDGKPSKAAGRVARDAKPYRYRYSKQFRDKPGAGRGTFTGPMAQDLEKSPLGASTVKRDKNGTRVVDLERSGLLALSAAGQALKELDALKEQLNGA